MKTTFQVGQSGVDGQESLEPLQVVQQAGGEAGGGELPGELRHHQHCLPPRQLSALDHVGVEMVPAVENRTSQLTRDLPRRPQETGQLLSLASTEDSARWDLLQLRGRTETPRVCADQLEQSPV